MGPTRWKQVRGKWAPCHMHQDQIEKQTLLTVVPGPVLSSLLGLSFTI